MHICFLSSMHRFNDKRVVDKEAVCLVQAGHEVVHICPGSEDDIKNGCAVRTIIYTPPRGIRGRISQLMRLYRIAKQVNADVYHCNEVDSWFLGVCLRLLRGRPCVFDVHEHYPSTFAQQRFPRRLQPLAAAAVRGAFLVLLPFTKHVVLAKKTVSQDFPTDPGKKVLVRNFASLEAIRFAANEKYERANSPATMVHLGLFGKHRGWPQVLEAMAMMRHSEARLKVIGDINDGTRPEFEARVKELRLAERVEIYDWMPFREAFSHLTKGHIGLVTFQPGILNHDYAMPHKMFDYMAAGMAVVCPAFAVEVAPVVEETQSGVLIDPSSSEDIAAKLDSLLDDREKLAAMGRRGQHAVKQKYNWEAEARKLMRMYADLENKILQ